MKSLCLPVIFAICSSAFGQEDPWLPTPDGYKWPDESKTVISDEITWKTSDLDKVTKEGILSIWPDDNLPEVIRVRKADLNQDGKDELFIYIPEYSGTGGSTYEIITPTKDGYLDIGGVQGGISLDVSPDSWLQIEGSSRGGGGHYTRYLLRYVKGQYIEVRNEGHDYNTQIVTVRTNRTEQGAAANP